MFKTLITRNHFLFEEKLSFSRNVFNFYSNLSISSSPNHRITEFESLINSEKSKANNYIVIEDKCNVLPKLNAENVSLLLETKVNEVLKWTFNEKSCALIQINDNNYSLKREIRRNMGIETRNKKSFTNSLRYICLTTCPKLLSNSSRTENPDLIQRLDSRRKSLYLNVNNLKESFKSNEDLLQYLLSDKNDCDLNFKLRFYIIRQLERYICQSFFKNHQILPFGSSIAGLGTQTSDLDLVLIPRKLDSDSDSKDEDRKRLKHNLSLIADLLETSIPLYSHFSRILKARIPIIKFGFELAPIDIDLSIEISPYSVHHGVYMSAFLNYCIQLNPQLKDLIVLLKIWGKQHKLLKPKNWTTHMVYNGFTSFQLTALVIFFLQREGLVPPMKHFLSSNQAFKPRKGPLDVIQLLSAFFEFVLSLRFEWEGISILNATTYSNPDPLSNPIYMENPFDTQLNMCRNITRVKFDKFLEKTSICSDIMREQDFSLALIFDSELQNPVSNKSTNFRIRVKDLFTDS